MPYDLVLLPLIGGYWFVSLCNPTRLSFAKESGERLLFGAATAGVILASVCWGLASVAVVGLPNIHAYWRSIAPPWNYSGTALLAFASGPVAAWLINCFIKPLQAEAHAVATRGNGLERLFWDASEPSHSHLVQVTMDDGKVYVGWIERTAPNPRSPDGFVRILPTGSGFRDQQRRFQVTTEYGPVYRRLLDDGEISDRELSIIDAFVKVLPVSRIVSAGIYLPSAHALFHEGVSSA